MVVFLNCLLTEFNVEAFEASIYEGFVHFVKKKTGL